MKTQLNIKTNARVCIPKDREREKSVTFNNLQENTINISETKLWTTQFVKKVGVNPVNLSRCDAESMKQTYIGEIVNYNIEI